jgi:hypothetical protein
MERRGLPDDVKDAVKVRVERLLREGDRRFAVLVRVRAAQRDR